jgi:hypothetical protein
MAVRTAAPHLFYFRVAVGRILQASYPGFEGICFCALQNNDAPYLFLKLNLSAFVDAGSFPNRFRDGHSPASCHSHRFLPATPTARRLDGVGKYLLSINGNIVKHAGRLSKLEERVNKLDGGAPPA